MEQDQQSRKRSAWTMAQSKAQDQHSSILKCDGNGWDIKLFEQSMDHLLCAHCESVCCDAVELGCDHDEDDVLMYCQLCLQTVVNQGGNKCPLSGHSDPIIVPSRSSRRQISKSPVICPYSSAMTAAADNIDDGLWLTRLPLTMRKKAAHSECIMFQPLRQQMAASGRAL